jgi:hypothetical protein
MIDRNAAAKSVAHLFGRPGVCVVGEEKGACTVGYLEGRDVCVIARGKTWDEVLAFAEQRVNRVDQMLRETPATSDATVATAASVPVRFVRLRRRDLTIRP